MYVSISVENEKEEHVLKHYVGVKRIARGISADDIILYFNKNGGQYYPYNDYRTEKINGSLKIENAIVNSVDKED